MTKRVSYFDGATTTTKFLIPLEDCQVETSLIERPDKNIICFSTCVGCPVGCKFCISGVENNYVRKLFYNEMVTQILTAYKQIKDYNKVTVISAMGEGEPSINIQSVIEAMEQIKTRFPYKSFKFAISTAGLNLKRLQKVVDEIIVSSLSIKLQFSVHSVSHRDSIIPNSKIDLKEALSILLTANLNYNLQVELNFTLIKGVNDSDFELVANVLESYKKLDIKLNQFNPFSLSDLEHADEDKYEEFVEVLSSRGFNVEYYKTDGSNIIAACGLLRYSNL